MVFSQDSVRNSTNYSNPCRPMLVTIFGKHYNGVIQSNAGEFRPKNWRLYSNNEGYWILKLDGSQCDIIEFIYKQ